MAKYENSLNFMKLVPGGCTEYYAPSRQFKSIKNLLFWSFITNVTASCNLKIALYRHLVYHRSDTYPLNFLYGFIWVIYQKNYSNPAKT